MYQKNSKTKYTVHIEFTNISILNIDINKVKYHSASYAFPNLY